MGFGPLPYLGWRRAQSRARYVRALLSHRLRRQGRRLRRRLHGGNQLASGTARLRWSAVMIRRTPQIVALTILLPATNCGSIAYAQDMFKLLSEKEIRARVVGM